MIILWKNGTGLYAKLQKWFSGHPYSHVAIYLGNILGKDWVYEAGFSVSANPVDLKSKNIDTRIIDLNDYESGMYLVSIKGLSCNITKKVIKN